MVETKPQEAMTPTTTIGINGVLPRMEMVLSFLTISLCVGVERRIVVGILPTPQTVMVVKSKAQLLLAYLTLILT